MNSVRSAGFSIIELIVVVVVMGVIAASVGIFISGPIRGSVDLALRAELVDAADTALRRMARDLQLALPNSIRLASAGGATYLEYLEVRTGGRYRAEPTNPATSTASPSTCPDTNGDSEADEDVLDFTQADTCFRSLGDVPNLAQIVPNSDYLVIYNLGTAIANANAWEFTGTGGNKSLITSVSASVNNENLITFQSHQFRYASPGNRFNVVSGPVSYVCNPATGELRRVSSYPISTTQSTSLAAGVLLASGVSACTISYVAGATERNGVVAVTLTLSRNNESVTLYHEIHVDNVP